MYSVTKASQRLAMLAVLAAALVPSAFSQSCPTAVQIGVNPEANGLFNPAINRGEIGTWTLLPDLTRIRYKAESDFYAVANGAKYTGFRLRFWKTNYTSFNAPPPLNTNDAGYRNPETFFSGLNNSAHRFGADFRGWAVYQIVGVNGDACPNSVSGLIRLFHTEDIAAGGTGPIIPPIITPPAGTPPTVTVINNTTTVVVNNAVFVNVNNVVFPAGINAVMTCTATGYSQSRPVYINAPQFPLVCPDPPLGVPVTITLLFNGFPTPVVVGTFIYSPVSVNFIPGTMAARPGQYITGQFVAPTGATFTLTILTPAGPLPAINWEAGRGFLIPIGTTPGSYLARIEIRIGTLVIPIAVSIEVLPPSNPGVPPTVSTLKYTLIVEEEDPADGTKPALYQLSTTSGYVKPTLKSGRRYKFFAAIPDGAFQVRTTGYFLHQTNQNPSSSTDAPDPNFFCAGPGRALLVTFARFEGVPNDVPLAWELNFQDTGLAPCPANTRPPNAVSIQFEGSNRHQVGQTVRVALKQNGDTIRTWAGLYVVNALGQVFLLGDADTDFVREHGYTLPANHGYFGWSQRDGLISDLLEVMVGQQ